MSKILREKLKIVKSLLHRITSGDQKFKVDPKTPEVFRPTSKRKSLNPLKVGNKEIYS